MCFDFLYKFVWSISHSKKNLARYDKKIYIGLHFEVPVILVRF